MYTARWTCPAWPGHRMGPVYRYLRTWLLRAWRAGEHSLWPDVALAAALSLAAVWLTIHAADASGGERPLPLDVSPPAGQPPAPDAWPNPDGTEVARDVVPNLLITVPLIGRRRWPLACLTVQFAGLLPFDYRVNAATLAALVIGAYSLAVYGRSALLSMGTLLVAAGVTAGVKSNTWPPLPERAGAFAILLPIGLFGVAIRAARSRAGAAGKVLDADPEQARGALSAIEASGRETMTELRHLLGVLTPGPTDDPLHPQPGLDQLDALIDNVRQAGQPVSARRTPVALPRGMDLTAYRVVQEALTNALRYAPGAPTDIAITIEPSAGPSTVEGRTDLVIEVTNDASPPGARPDNSAGT